MGRSELRSWLLSNAFGRGNKVYSRSISREIQQLLENLTSFLPVKNCKVSTRVYAFLNGQTKPTKCLTCNEITPLTRGGSQRLYCGPKCSANSSYVKNKRSNSCLVKYGVKYANQNDKVISIVKKKLSDRYHQKRDQQILQVANWNKESLRQYILEYCFKDDGSDVKNNPLVNSLPSVYSSLRKFTSFLPDNASDKIRIYIFLSGLDQFNCIICGEPLNPLNCNHLSLHCSNECAARSTIIRDKTRNTNIDRYGVDNCAYKHIDSDILVILKTPHLLDQALSNYSPKALTKKWGISASVIYRYIKSYGLDDYCYTSAGELFWQDVLNDLNVEFIASSRKIIPPLELDLYMPKYQLAIEYNGVYWHSELSGKKDKNYHLEKTLLCKEQGIQLLHIFDTDNQDLWVSVVKNKLGLYDKKIGARETVFREVGHEESNEFLMRNHLQGAISASIRYGLYYHGRLVSLALFSKPRYNSSYDYELLRFCSERDWVIIGGASKLLSKLRGSCISYANRRWSNGNLYDKLGFRLSHVSPPNFFYTDDYHKLYSRNKFQKFKLSKELKRFDPCKTEYENMLDNGYDRIWDSGNLVYVKDGVNAANK